MLTPDEVHVWHVDLGRAAAEVGRLEPLLSSTEAARAARFKFLVDRDRFIAGRATLRRILSHYLAVAPADLALEYGAHGKPFLAEADNPHDLRFNLAHSHELMLCALGRGRELGIDVEYLRDDVDFADIAQSFFAPREIAALRQTPAHLKKQAFFTCWTRKEAYVKACGQGLSLPLDKFTVPVLDSDPMRLRSEEAPVKLTKWRLESLPTEPDYAAALVVEGHDFTLTFKDWYDDAV